jgi:hypothetical protein
MHVTDASVDVTVRGWSADTSSADRDARARCCADFTNRVCWPNGAPADAAVDAPMDASDDAAMDVGSDIVIDATADDAVADTVDD